MFCILKFVVKFACLLFIMTVFCTWAWDAFLNGKVYYCTDGGTFDYWCPGDWVHTHDGSPIVEVDKIVPAHSMSDPDTLKSGWSVAKLWDTWAAFLGGSLVISIGLACLNWTKWLDLPNPSPSTG